MCSAPDPGKPDPIPVRQAMVLPDSGDPTVRQSIMGRRKLARSLMMFSTRNGGVNMPIGMAQTTNPGGA